MNADTASGDARAEASDRTPSSKGIDWEGRNIRRLDPAFVSLLSAGFLVCPRSEALLACWQGLSRPKGLAVTDAPPTGTNDLTDLSDAAEAFIALRPKLFGIAYRMLGSVSEAEDIVQEVWLRWQATDRSVVENPAAFLTTTTTRMAINVLKSARVRRESYVGPWLPDPVDTSADPQLGAERGEALDLAVLLLLEKLSPMERAAYILREAFDYPYGQIGSIIQTSETNTRQLVSRARKRIGTDRREPVSASEQRRLLEAFLSAAQSGNFEELEQLFAADAVSYSDGGGAVRGVARIPVRGAATVVRFILGFGSRFWPGSSIIWVESNGRPGVVIRHGDKVTAHVTVDASADGINQVMWVLNPAKLTSITARPPSIPLR